MELFTKKAEQIVINYMISTMPKIKVKSGICRYNHKCHKNAVHDALDAGEDRIAMCFHYNGDRPTIHFINIDVDGVYIDNTLGRWSETQEYYLIRFIDKDSFFSVDTIFDEYRKYLRSKMPLYVQWFSDWEF